MKVNARKYSWGKRLVAFALAVLMVVGYFPTAADAASEPGSMETVADPGTLPRPTEIYGKNTQNAGKVTVGKSVATDEETVSIGGHNFQAEDNNFLITVSQYAQVMGLAAETSVPVDVVFVLDTSGSMDENNRKSTMVTAVNNAIKTLMASNANNRVGVVAFSDIDTNGWGQVTEPAAEVLSKLASYTGNAATNHLTWSGSNIVGRGTGAGSRDGGNGGTNIQAGVALGANMLASATDLTVDGVTRMPFLIILSDGAPTYNFTDSNWYNPSMTGSQYGPGNDEGTLYTGNGFLPALVAAYYKGVITEHYYGANASEDNRCSIYTLGVSLDNSTLAKLTMDPNANFNANATGSSHGARFATYWKNYQAGNTFSISCDDNENYSITKNSINATKNYVNGISSTGKTMYTGGIAYNDDYFNATNTSDINGIFDKVVSEIQKKAISSPTHVGTHGADFSGYVTFTDPLGEYMELKEMKGIVADGNFYQGAGAARRLAAYGQSGNANNDPEFDALLKTVLQKRLSMTASQATDAFIRDFAQKALASDHQVYWNSNSDYDNSIVWWGNSYPSGEEDEMVQILGFADDDSIEYIEKQQAAKTVPADADYVCRSYFFYGTAGDTVQSPNHEYLYFVVRVQRELTAPYKQTVVISAPASLLAVEEVFITEETGTNGAKTYTAEVTPADPARVIYEVGLRSDINPQNVAEKVSADYKGASVDSGYSVNYDEATDTYYFFTNDWNRTVTGEEHHRALAKATFDAAADNAFYAYQQNTTITDERGNAYKGTTKPSGTWYYVREYYDWSQATYNSATGVYTGVQKENAVIQIELAADAGIQRASDGTWYIPQGVYAASTLVVNGDDVGKDNKTGTAEIVAHPHRTGSSSNSHYTVLLGNNGRLAVVSDPAKSVSIGDSNENANGKPVMVGETLTYTIKVVNNEGTKANAVVTDTVPKGTEYVSSDNNGRLSQDGKTVTWNLTDIPAGGSKTVSFKVKVLPSAIAGAGNVDTISNTATIKVGNNPAYTTNTVTNPPEGKKVTDTDGNEFADGTTLKVGDVLVYRVRAYNDTGDKAVATITDKIPDGTTYVPGSADHGGVYDAATNTITWTFADNTANGGTDQRLEANTSVVVSFRVEVDASAKQSIANQATIQIGNRNPDTNLVTTPVDTGSISIEKIVDEGNNTDEEFTLILNESQGKLNGTYTMTGGNQSEVTFENGVSTSTVTIKNGQTLTIQGLPLGAGINVAEAANAGWTPSYEVGADDVTAAFVTVSNSTPVVTITNNYHAQPAHFQLKGTKTFVGDSFPAGSFTFNAVQVNEDGSAYSGNTTPITVTATVRKTETGANTMDIVFDARSFSDDMTRYYKITENASDIPGVISDSTAYLLMLKVTDNDEGQLVLTAKLKKATDATTWENVPEIGAAGSTALSFTNYYPDDSEPVTISGTKTLTNRYIQDNEFSFELVENGKVVDTVLLKSDGDGTAPFSFTRKYTAADMAGATEKTFYYTVREVKGQDSTIKYSTATFDVAVKVTMNDQGKLVATVDYDTATDGVQSNSNIAFTNTFTPSGATLNLTGEKTLYNGATDDTTDTIVPVPAFSFGVYSGDTQIASATNDAEGKFTFTPIGYTLADMVGGTDNGTTITKVFTYTVKENVPATDAYTYDHSMAYSDKVYAIEVTVTYQKSDGTMTAAVTEVDNVQSSNTNYTFTNTKYPENVTVLPVAYKTVTGSVPAGLRFSFSVVNAETGIEAATGISTATNAASNVGLSVEFTHMVYDYSNWLANRDSDTSDTATLYYWIQESNTANGWVDENTPGNGVDYDENRYLMKVVLTYNNGQLTPAVTYYNDNGAATLDEVAVENNKLGQNQSAEFFNEYKAAGSINLTAVKNIEGGTGWTADQFDFHLQRWDETTGKVVPGSEIVGINGEFTNGAAPVNFATLNYSAENLNQGDIKYVMTEVDPGMAAIPGVTYDKAAYIVTIRLETEGGSIKASVTSVQKATFTGEGEDRVYTAGETIANATKTNEQTNTWNVGDAVFTNKYAPTSVDVEIKATKTLTGRDLKPGEFGFELYRIQKNDQGGFDEFLAATTTNVDSNTTDDDANPNDIIFKRTYNTANLSSSVTEYTVTYAIKETKGSLGGVSYTDNVYYAQVKITHNQDNAEYTVSDPVYYDENPLDATKNAAVIGEVVFENAYSTNNAYYTPVAFKSFKEKLDGEHWTDRNIGDNQFTFSVFEVNENGNVLAGGAAVAAGVSKVGGSVEFGRLTYSHNAIGGTYAHYYKIVEDQGNEPGVTYDTNKAYYLKVTINDNGNGVLSVTEASYFATVQDMKNGANAIYKQTFTTDAGTTTMTEDGIKANVLFTNHYGPGSITIHPGDLKKIVEVKDNAGVVYHLTGSEFNFDLYAYSGTADEWKDENWVPAAADLVTSGTNGASVNGVAPINFGSITYTSEQVRNNNTPDADGKYTATYNYIVVERDLDDASVARGLTKDGKKIKLTVKVTDDGYGNLTVLPSGIEDSDSKAENELTFTNVYDAPELKVQFTGDKTLVNKKMEAGEFKFLLEWNENGVDKGEYLLNDADGKITSSEFVFTSAGEYIFTMREVDKDSVNYKCDDSVYTIKVNVIDDLDGNLHAALSYTKTVKDENGDDVTTDVAGIDFVNTYIPSAIEVDLNTAIGATKTVLDPDGNVMEDKVQGFDFELFDVTGAVVATGTSDATGRIFFNKITFQTAGEYHFRIREAENADKPGYTLDAQQWRVYVLVRYYDGTGTAPVVNGTPVAPGSLYVVESDVQTFPVGDMEAHSETAPTFVNIYNPEPLHLSLQATKKLIGRDLRDGEFTFHLEENGILRGEAKNQADGTISFALTYTLPGEYTYELHEYVPSAHDKLEGVTYDEKVYTVKVTVEDQNGKLVIDGTTSTWDTGVTFENTYKPGATTATINARKTLEGKPLTAGEFSFELLDSQNQVIDKVTNDAAGNVVFTVEVPAADEYHYSVREVQGTDTDHYTYDKNVYKVTVKASQNAAGKLVTEVSYDTADGKMPVFENTYKPDGTTITLEGTKKLTGRDMAAGEFKFEVRDSVGTLVATGTNDAEGNIDFTAVKLPVAGTYKLTVTEVKGSAEGMTYDSSAFAVTVNVVNDNGVLVATAEYPEAGIVFTNAYEKVEETTVPETTVPETTEPEKPKDPTVPDTGDHAKLGLWIAVLAGSVLLFAVTFVVVIIPRKKGTYEK